MDNRADPICGNCKEPRSKHMTEPSRDDLFCYPDTTGDIFTDEPTVEDLLELLEESDSGRLEQLTRLWQQLNGHI